MGQLQWQGLRVGDRPTAAGGEARRLVRLALLGGFALYLAGLVIWLGIGLLPTVSAHLAVFRHVLERAGAGHGAWATIAARIADRSMLMGGLAMVVVQSLFSALNLVLGLILLLHRSSERICQLLALAVLGTAATFNAPSHQVFDVLGKPPVIKGLHFAFHVISGTATCGLCSSSRRWWPAAADLAPAAGRHRRRGGGRRRADHLEKRLFAPPAILRRVLRRADPGRWHRRHHRAPAGGHHSRGPPAVPAPARGARAGGRSGGGVDRCMGGLTTATGAARDAHRLDGWLETATFAVFAVVPVMLFVGVLRYRLWDIDVVVGRGLLYGSFAAAAGSAYVVAVVVAGAVTTGLWLTALVMAAVAVAVDPLRRVLRTAANRVVFGQSLTPSEGMRALADGLARLTPGDELAELTRVAACGTRAAGAELWVAAGERLLLFARWPERGAGRSVLQPDGAAFGDWAAAIGESRCEPVRYHDRLLGVLALRLHAGVFLPPEEERLVADLVGHAGLLVHNAGLAAELARQLDALEARTAELRASLAELVAAQDAERKKLERDIHDGAQQELVALLMTIRAVGPDLAGDDRAAAARAAAELDEMRAMVESTAHNLERLCGGDLPAILVEEGPAAMLQTATAPLRRTGLRVEVRQLRAGRAPLGVEAAVYFCCLEAAQNAAKHAQASTLTIEIDVGDGEVRLAVTDDGIGFDQSALAASRGLGNLARRIEDADGTLVIESARGQGTRVLGRIPLVAATRPLASPVGSVG